MAQSSRSGFQDWIKNNDIPESIEKCLLEKGYNNVDLICFMTVENVDHFKLNKNDKCFLKNVLKLRYKDEEEDDEDEDTDDDEDEQEEEDDDFQECISPITELRLPENARLAAYQTGKEQLRPEIAAEQLRWKEFGFVRPYKKWEKNFLPVELFSPDGFWAWNSSAKSLTFGKEKINDIWMRFDNNKPGWLMSPPALLPAHIGAFKLSFSLRIIPKRVDDSPKLQVVLVNDCYNKRMIEIKQLPLKLHLIFKFINLSTGSTVGNEIRVNWNIEDLFDEQNFRVPGNVLALKKPPIIAVQAMSN